ncbi:MAG TPA: helix-turn-helix domain-containing protein [Pirellulaceae bacterium]|nr:helix-turn-helix domain-containing protein [Pirellulaceae bacterium]
MGDVVSAKDLPDIVDCKLAADFLGLSDRRVRQFIKSTPPRLPTVKVGNAYGIPKEALIAFAKVERSVGRPPST